MKTPPFLKNWKLQRRKIWVWSRKTDATPPFFEELEASKEEDAGLEKENGIPGTLRGKKRVY